MFTMISDHYPYNRFSLNFDVISKKSKEKFREMFEEEPFAGIELVKSAEGNIIRKIYLVG
jgi:ASC-1-like (ASCH) protein